MQTFKKSTNQAEDLVSLVTQACCVVMLPPSGCFELLHHQTLLYPGQQTVMAATMETAAGMSNMLQFMKLIGQLKVRLLPKLRLLFW